MPSLTPFPSPLPVRERIKVRVLLQRARFRILRCLFPAKAKRRWVTLPLFLGLFPRLARLRLQSGFFPFAPPLDFFLPFARHLTSLLSSLLSSPAGPSVPPLRRIRDEFQPWSRTACP